MKLGAAAMVVFVCWLFTKANSNTEHTIATTMASPPDGIRWLVSVVWWATSIGIIALIAGLALVSRRWSAIRDIGISGAGSWVGCVLLTVLLGSTGGRPPDPSLHAFDLTFPVARVAATVGVATAALPYLSRWLQRGIEIAIVLLAVAAVVNGSGLPLAILASVALGWGTTALVHLILGSPLGLPSTTEVLLLLADLDIEAETVVPVADQEWGVGRFTGHLDGHEVDVSVYGRDASDAQLLAKTARFLFYRDSGPTLTLTRRQQVEHEAYVTLMAARAGARVPAVLAAGPAGPAHDALLVTRPPEGRPLAIFAPPVTPDQPAQAAPDETMAESNAAAPAVSAPNRPLPSPMRRSTTSSDN